ncbi:MAG TPA: sulfatase [Acidobacteriaceae bacterium]|nr:sulfatase [Acidobacteriaceae bacterium]
MAEFEPENGVVTTRRDFMQGSIAVAGSALASSMPVSAAAQPKEKRPNLLFIYTEGQRADAQGIAGNPLLKTPNQDRIAQEGVRFNNSFCTNALCAPARATALTGLYSKTTGARSNPNNHPNQPLPADIPIFTDLLHKAGYEVAIVGKVHVQNGVRERYWDYYFGFNAAVTNYYFPTFREGRKGVIGKPVTYKNKYADDLVTDKALAWLNEKHEKPVCLLVWYQTPHAPFYRPRRLLDLYNGVPIPKPETFDDDLKGYPGKPRAVANAHNKIGTQSDLDDDARSLEELVKDYYAGLVAVDENIGRLFEHLEKSGQMDETAVFFSSDHGYFLGEWRMFDKRLMHEPSIRVPMSIRYPKKIKAGTVREEMVLNTDIAPTLLDLAGVPVPDHMQGKSLIPLAQGHGQPEWRKEWLYEYFEYPGWENVRPNRGVRTDRYKLIHYYLEPQEFELYDLVDDPGERNNLYGNSQHAALQKDLIDRMQRLRKEIPGKDSLEQN